MFKSLFWYSVGETYERGPVGLVILGVYKSRNKGSEVGTVNPTPVHMVAVAKLVKAADCGSAMRGFESHRSPFKIGKPDGSSQ